MRYVVGCLVVPAMLLVVGLVWNIFGPADRGSLGCEVHRRYNVEAVIVADGRRIRGEATRVELRPRFRYGQMFSLDGCTVAQGRAIAFRLPRDRIVLMSAGACTQASEALGDRDTVDALTMCHSPAERERRRNSEYFKGDAYIIEGIDAPRAWRHVTFGDGEVELVRLRYTDAFWAGASDSLEAVAPALLATRFEHRDWEGPINLIPDKRRDGHPLEHVAAMPMPVEPPLDEASDQ
jgi:hypothetical protein